MFKSMLKIEKYRIEVVEEFQIPAHLSLQFLQLQFYVLNFKYLQLFRDKVFQKSLNEEKKV